MDDNYNNFIIFTISILVTTANKTWSNINEFKLKYKKKQIGDSTCYKDCCFQFIRNLYAREK